MEPSAGVRVELLGDVRLVTPTTVVDGSALAARRVRVALAYLALERARAVDRHELAEVAWPYELPATWASALRTVLTQVRVALREAGVAPDALRADAGQLRLNLPPASTTDVENALSLVDRAERSLVDGRNDEAVNAAAEARDLLGRGFLQNAGGTVRRRLASTTRRFPPTCTRRARIGPHCHRPAPRCAGAAEEAVAEAPFDEAIAAGENVANRAQRRRNAR